MKTTTSLPGKEGNPQSSKEKKGNLRRKRFQSSTENKRLMVSARTKGKPPRTRPAKGNLVGWGAWMGGGIVKKFERLKKEKKWGGVNNLDAIQR